MKEDDIPKSVWQGTIRLFGVDLQCHVLDDGQRVIEADSMVAFFKGMNSPDTTIDEAESKRFSEWLYGRG